MFEKAKSVDIVDYVKSKIDLEEGEPFHKGDCPFCDSENTLSVNKDKQYYYCFGCGEGGDIISFVKEYHNIELEEVIIKLCDFDG